MLMSGINFATFNIGGGVPCKQTLEYTNKLYNPINYIINLIWKYKLDVVCFQEILMEDKSHYSMSSEIASKSGLKYYNELMLSDSHIVKGRKMGVSIISKYPFVESEIFMLENPNISKILKSGVVYKSHEKGFLISKVQTNIGEICCVTGHCIPFHSFDRDVMEFKYIYTVLEKKLLKLLDESLHIIVGADFNTSRLSLLMPEVFVKYQFFANISTRPNGRGDDYIFCNKENVNIKFRMIKTCYDHYGCMCVYK